MSLELVDECVKRLSQSLSQTQRILAVYDSKELQGLIYEMAKCESNYVQLHDSTKKAIEQYNSSLQRLVQINARLQSKPSVDLLKSPQLPILKKPSQQQSKDIPKPS